MGTRTLAVVTAGLGRPSSTRLLADRLGAAATAAFDGQGDRAQVEVIESTPMPWPTTCSPVSPGRRWPRRCGRWNGPTG